MRLLVSSLEFLKHYLSEESLQIRRVLLKQRIMKISRDHHINRVIRTDHYMSLFSRILDKALRQHGRGFKPTRSELLVHESLASISKIAQKKVHLQFIDELNDTRRILHHQKRLGRLRSPNKPRSTMQDPLAKGSSPNAHLRSRNKENRNENVRILVNKAENSRGTQQKPGHPGKRMKRGVSCVERLRKHASDSRIGPVLKRQPFSLNMDGNLRIREKIKRVLQTTFGSGKKGFWGLQSQKKEQPKKKPLFLNQEIAKRFSKTSENNKRLRAQATENRVNRSRDRSLNAHRRPRDSDREKQNQAKNRPKTKSRSKAKKRRRAGHFPPNFIDWRLELKQNQKIHKSFERLFKRGRLRGQVKRNQKKTEKKRKIHFYMLKKNNLVGENFVISSVEQSFLLKHIVLFSIVKNNLFYRLTKINFNYSDKDVNMKGSLTRLAGQHAALLLVSRGRTRGRQVPGFERCAR